MPASARDLFLLEAHHSKPCYIRAIRPRAMGWDGRKKKGGGGSGQGSWDSWQPSQYYWQGDKASQNQPKGAQSLLTPYDTLRVEPKSQSAGTDLAQALSSSSTQDDSLVKNLQSCVNMARKAEGKVKRLALDRATKVAQWEAYERQVREAFLAEKRRHTQDLDTLDADIAKAIQSQELAREKVRQAAAGPVSSVAPVTRDEDMGPDPWLDLVSIVPEEAPPDDTMLRAVLARAMQPPSGGSIDLSTPPRRSAEPRTPVSRVGQGLPPAVTAPGELPPDAAREALGHAARGINGIPESGHHRPSCLPPQTPAFGCPVLAQATGAHNVGADPCHSENAPLPASAPGTRCGSRHPQDQVSGQDPLPTAHLPQPPGSLPFLASAANLPQVPGTGQETLDARSGNCALPTATRLQPFPPPRVTSVHTFAGHYLCGSPGAAVSDPYVSADQGHPRALSPALSISPASHKPRTPKPRIAIKESSKPTGPLHLHPPAEGRAALMEEKRHVASNQLGVPFGDAPVPLVSVAEAHVPNVPEGALPLATASVDTGLASLE